MTIFNSHTNLPTKCSHQHIVTPTAGDKRLFFEVDALEEEKPPSKRCRSAEEPVISTSISSTAPAPIEQVAGAKRLRFEDNELEKEKRPCKKSRSTDEPPSKTTDVDSKQDDTVVVAEEKKDDKNEVTDVDSKQDDTVVIAEKKKDIRDEANVEQVPTEAAAAKLPSQKKTKSRQISQQVKALKAFMKDSTTINRILRGQAVARNEDARKAKMHIPHVISALSSEGALDLVPCGPTSGPPSKFTPGFVKTLECAEMGATTLYRGVTKKAYIDEYTRKDGYFCDPAFFSTSKSEDIGKGFASMSRNNDDHIIIKVKTSPKNPKGKSLCSGKMFKRTRRHNEQEVLFPPSTVFHIDRISGQEVVLSEVGTEDSSPK